MARLLLVEWDPELAEAAAGILEAAGHHVTHLRAAADVLPLLQEDPLRFDVVVLGMMQPETRSFDVVKELCRIPAFSGLGKILIFPVTADRREALQMYGERGYCNFGPQLPRTMAVYEPKLPALNEAIATLLDNKGC